MHAFLQSSRVLSQLRWQWLAPMQPHTRPAKLPRLSTAVQEGLQDSMSGILDTQDWANLQQHYAHYDAQRETVIKRSRDGQKAAKQAIYSLHRGDFDRATQQLHAAEQVGKELLPIVQKEPTLRQGSYAGVMEEYAEGRVFKAYLQEGRILRSSELAELVNADEYLGGVLDFTGELNRYAVARATARDVPAVQRARDVVDALQGQFLQMDLRNGALRKKFDSLKYTLRKLENMLYELSLAGAPGLTSTGLDSREDEQPADNTMDNDAQA